MGHAHRPKMQQKKQKTHMLELMCGSPTMNIPNTLIFVGMEALILFKQNSRYRLSKYISTLVRHLLPMDLVEFTTSHYEQMPCFVSDSRLANKPYSFF